MFKNLARASVPLAAPLFDLTPLDAAAGHRPERSAR
jgi:hypothetical protein